MTSVEEIIKQERQRIDIKSKWLANHVFAGDYRSGFKGLGMRFKEVREYQAGDDERFIDWNVTARMGLPFTKIFEEEKELPVYLLADISSSMSFGSLMIKREMVTRLCADLSYSAISNNDKVGLLLFSEKIEKYIPPQKKSEHVEYIVRELYSAKPTFAKTDLIGALEFLNNKNITPHRSIIFILSDFAAENYENALGVVARRHDVIGLKVYDKYDKELPRAGWLQVRDFETGIIRTLNTRSARIRREYEKQFQQIIENTASTFTKVGAGLLSLESGKEYIHELQQFFLQRRR